MIKLSFGEVVVLAVTAIVLSTIWAEPRPEPAHSHAEILEQLSEISDAVTALQRDRRGDLR